MLFDLPLHGLRVIDLTNVIMGPLPLLGDLGADVIKVEDVEEYHQKYRCSKISNMSSIYLGVNRNKGSIRLNLKIKSSKQVLWKLIESSDVFIHNMRPQNKSLRFFANLN